MFDYITEVITELTWFDIFSIMLVPILSGISIRNIARFFRRRKAYFKQLKELEDKKCKGPHSWIEMDLLGKKSHVCKDCCYCSEHDLYVKEYYVKSEVEATIFGEELKKYTDKRLGEISKSYGLDKEELKNMLEEAVSIKKDFVLQYLDKKIDEMKEGAE